MTAPGRLRIDLESVSLEALTWGPETGPLALCLHGFPDTAHTWRHLGPSLAADGWRVVAPFTRGYAPSTVPTDGGYHIGALMADAIGVHAALGGGDDAVVIGHDWGAVTSNGLAAYENSPFAAAVSMSVPPSPAIAAAGGRRLFGRARLLAAQSVRSSYMAYFQLPVLPERTFHALLPRLWALWSPGYDASRDVQLVRDSLRSNDRVRSALGYYRALARPWSVPDRHRALQHAWATSPRVPVLYLHGADDGCFGAEFAAGMDRYLPDGSRVEVVPAAGHFLHLERPDVVAHHVSAFLTR